MKAWRGRRINEMKKMIKIKIRMIMMKRRLKKLTSNLKSS